MKNRNMSDGRSWFGIDAAGVGEVGERKRSVKRSPTEVARQSRSLTEVACQKKIESEVQRVRLHRRDRGRSCLRGVADMRNVRSEEWGRFVERARTIVALLSYYT